jgi:hypothetical protein
VHPKQQQKKASQAANRIRPKLLLLLKLLQKKASLVVNQIQPPLLQKPPRLLNLNFPVRK